MVESVLESTKTTLKSPVSTLDAPQKGGNAETIFSGYTVQTKHLSLGSSHHPGKATFAQFKTT